MPSSAAVCGLNLLELNVFSEISRIVKIKQPVNELTVVRFVVHVVT